jgi:hypothetical protein
MTWAARHRDLSWHYLRCHERPHAVFDEERLWDTRLRLASNPCRWLWYFGRKAQIGSDGKIKPIHAVVVTATNVYAATIPRGLFYGEETHLRDAQTYRGKSMAIWKHALCAKDFAKRRTAYLTWSMRLRKRGSGPNLKSVAKSNHDSGP